MEDSRADSEKLAIVVEACLLVVAVCVSVSLGLLVGAWLGFIVFAAFVMTFVVAVVWSYRKSHREEEL